MGQEVSDHDALKAEVAAIRQAMSFLIGELRKCPETKGAIAATRFHIEELHAVQQKSTEGDEHRKALCAIQMHTVEKLFDETHH